MSDIAPHQQLVGLISGYWVSQAIYAAAKFGIADLLKDGARSVADLAQASSTNSETSIFKRVRR